MSGPAKIGEGVMLMEATLAGVRDRRTPGMRALEVERGGDIRTLIVRAYNETGTLEGAAHALGVNAGTLYGWMLRLGVVIGRHAVAAE